MAKMIMEVPKEVKKAFKMACVTNEISMKDAINQLMKEYAKKGGGSKKK